ncbi:uncharacterized protein LOC131022910 [Salvia miltiorrhiza]|uniref:uncharacterized protein LOC131022910 n=1 Tax=Salvia miltiorrhiza TaxID=226208 RepID=UPI0025AC7655|nr:uncharacterized protein LOC131022910 [Salvia miltiorrhiza]
MDASKQSLLPYSFKSNKLLSSPAPSDRKVSDSNPDPLIVKTPGKPTNQLRRLHNRSMALSISDARKLAMKLQKRGSDPPARIDAVSILEEEEIAKLKKPDAAYIELPTKYERLMVGRGVADAGGRALVFANLLTRRKYKLPKQD